MANNIQRKVDKTVIHLYWEETILVDLPIAIVEEARKKEYIQIPGQWSLKSSIILRLSPYVCSHELEPRIEHNFPQIKDEILEIVLERSKKKWTWSKISKNIVANIAKSLLEEHSGKTTQVWTTVDEKKVLTPEQRANIKQFLQLKKEKLLNGGDSEKK